MDANFSEDESIIRRLEAALARWDRDGEETYRELAINLLRLVRIENKKNIPEKGE
jgi:hypothetical protein